MNEKAIERDSAFASDLGIPVGQWPHTIDYKGRTYTFGASVKDNEGDITEAVYMSYGHVLTVFNT